MTDEQVHLPNRCCDYHRHVADGCCHCERADEKERRAEPTSDPNAQRDFLVEVISWGEDIDTGRWGHERAAEMLDGYVERIVAERLTVIRDACRAEDARLTKRASRTQNRESKALFGRERLGWFGAVGIIDDLLNRPVGGEDRG